MKAADLFTRCLENEGVEYIFGVPGEETLQLVDSIVNSSTIKFIPTRHEQGAAFMADVYGRLTGRAGVCLSTLGPGATNLVTGRGRREHGHGPLVAISGQASTTRLHKISHQVIDLVDLFKPITKYGAQVRMPKTIPEIVRKAFKVAEAEAPGACFIEFPQNVQEMDIEGLAPLRRQSPRPALSQPRATGRSGRAARRLALAAHPGRARRHPHERVGATGRRSPRSLNIPVVTTFMAKGVIPASHKLLLGTAGLNSNDYNFCGFKQADLIICVGYDMVEYHPYLWRRDEHKLVHIHATAGRGGRALRGGRGRGLPYRRQPRRAAASAAAGTASA